MRIYIANLYTDSIYTRRYIEGWIVYFQVLRGWIYFCGSCSACIINEPFSLFVSYIVQQVREPTTSVRSVASLELQC